MLEEIRKILLPTDFSPASEQAADAAVALAKRYDADITLLHVYTVPAFSFPDGVYLAPVVQAVELSASAQRGLDVVAGKLRERGAKVQAVLREGGPEEEILAMAKDFDLVVMGTHARRGFTRVLLGSVADAVIRAGVAPVLVVPPKAEQG